jgi:hypothetical protein
MTRTKVRSTDLLIVMVCLSGCDAFLSSQTVVASQPVAAVEDPPAPQTTPAIMVTSYPTAEAPIPSEVVASLVEAPASPEVLLPVMGDEVAPDVDEVLHLGEIRGEVRTLVGKRLTITPLVALSSTMPEIGSTGNLWIKAGATDNDVYTLIAQARVISAVRPGAMLDLDIIEVESIAADGISLQDLTPGRSTRFEYVW